MMNEAQLQAVRSPHRFIFLFAGAGTGKTTVLLARIDHYIKQGIQPENILAMTFTRKSAHDMQSRFQHHAVTFQTFHAWSYPLIQQEVTLVDETLPFSRSELTAFSKYKNQLKKGIPPFRFHQYEAYLKKHQKIDYDDLLLQVYQKKHLPRYEAILIDEFQDTNVLQFELLKRLVSKQTYVFAVGDPDQTIYRFRGAHPNIIWKYIDYFHAKTCVLSMNYRSDRAIIKLANHLIQHDRSRVQKVLKSSQSSQGEIYITSFQSTISEARAIIRIIQASRYPRHEIAILCRTHRRMYEIKRLSHELGIIHGMYPDVHILTIHEAKGLEFDEVFMIGMEQSVIPGKKLNQEKILEERRLLYVAITRARHRLHLSYLRSKTMKPSQFLHEIKTFKHTLDDEKMV
jgi:DNA helicase-2/ATP-dependent DNA helicase PcrA